MTNLTRRSFLRASAAGAGALAVGNEALAAGAPTIRYFLHGVASGDPLPGAVVLWTRVTPTPEAQPGSGTGPTVGVRWQLAADPSFTRIVRSGSASTGPDRDHTVKVDATRLAAATTYWYRFEFDGVTSPVGRTRTAPSLLALVPQLRFGVVSCSNWEAGWFSPYRHLAARGDLDAVLHLGDYIYEYGNGSYGYGSTNATVRPHQPVHEIVSLADYRQRHGQYKTDPDLQALHAAAPWIVTWDDHETANDRWLNGAENHQPETEGSWAARAAAAQRAYDEWMPVRLSGTAAVGDGGRLYRRFRFGELAELSMLDLRSYRSRQVGNDLTKVNDPDRTITGPDQMSWLTGGLSESTAQWKLVGNPVMISPVVFPPLPAEVGRPLADITGLLPPDGVPYNVDQWDGYTADRQELFAHLADHGVTDTVFLTGDIHSAWACDLPVDAGSYPLGRTVGTELVCTSVTSNNLDDIIGTPPRTTSLTVEAAIRASNRHIRYLDFDSHGYSVLDLTPARTQMDYYVISDRRDRAATSAWSTSFVVTAGTQRVQQASGPVA
jgi:alkaline phosphatase D